MFNGFDAFGYTGARPCTERCLRRFPGSGSTGPMTMGTTPRVIGAISGLACLSYRVVDVVVHVVPELTSHATSRPTPEGTSERVPCDKGKRPTKAVGSPDRAPTMRDLCEQGVHFVGTLIDRVHDTGRVVALKKSEQCRKDLELVADSTYTKLKDLRDSRRRLEDEVLSLTKAAEVLQSKLKAEGRKAVTYELGYRVVLERFRAKYPESYVEEDPFAEWSEDANIRMEACQPFDDSTMPEE
ncbi:hypothetical protein BHE74_00033224 [Ensete ventricosum]|nr:hypothetical protein BHE74_00033224 [Ensete ventricosum]